MMFNTVLEANSNRFCLKFSMVLLALINIICVINSKYTFQTNNQDKVQLESLIRNYALNMVDTKFLKISNYNERSDLSKKEKKIDDVLVDQYSSTLGGENDNDENKDVISGSIMISDKGQLIFSKDFIDQDNSKSLKGRKLIARARYTKSLAQIGWSRLFVETFDNTSAEVQAWAAGFLEGKLTAREMLDFYKNLISIHTKESEYLSEVFEYYKKVEESIRNRTSKDVLAKISNRRDLEYWISVAMTQAQTDGLHAGYNTIMKDEPLTLAQIYFLNADGEVPELLTVFKTKKINKDFSQYSFREGATKSFLTNKKVDKFSKEYLQQYFGSSDPETVWNTLMMNSHCSAIIKVLRDYDNSIKDVLVAHTTWDSYAEMHRIFKEYKFSYTMYGTHKKNSLITFSAYPGTLTSTDDFYVLNNNIVVLETTLEILDRSLYETKIPQAEEHVPNYIRISVANRLASSGRDWTDIFKLNNGGTYNSQWMVLDFSKLKVNNADESLFKDSVFNNFIDSNNKEDSILSLNKPDAFSYFSFKENFSAERHSSKGFFHILEQIPGYIEVKDMTDHLFNRGYWASFNRPYLDKIYRDAGYYDMMMRYSRTYSYEDNPRGHVIKARINQVNDIESLKNLMQTNRNLQDTDYINSISPRYDLAVKPALRKTAGGIDTKIVSSDLVQQQAVLAISGPSNLGGVPPFRWSDWPEETHHGLPDLWNFDWLKLDETFIKNQ